MVSAAMVGVGLVAAGCSSVKMGAAAIVGDQRITIATLDTEITNLHQAAVKYPGVVQLNQQQMTQEALTWLVRFQINEELARQNGITVSTAQAEQAWLDIYNSAKADAAAAGVPNASQELILAANGIPPDKQTELGRWQAIETQFVKNANGGTLPTSNTAQTAAGAQLQHAQCQAAKALNIEVNPQFGQLDYSKLQVITAPSTVTRAEGPTPAASSSSGLAPAC
jgi:hypothetical protein